MTRPVPTELHVVRGTRSRLAERRRAAGQEPADAPTPSGVPPAPAGLRAPGREAWANIWTFGATWLRESDRLAVSQICTLVDDAAELREVIRREGFVALNKRTRRSHVHASYNNLLGLYRAIERQMASLGLTPADRQRLHADRDAGEDPTSAWLAGGKP
jgi:P27 family predicted phage terminase small subunit